MDTEDIRTDMLKCLASVGSDNTELNNEFTDMIDSLFPTEEDKPWHVSSFTVVAHLPEELWCLRYRSGDKYQGIMTRGKPSVKCFIVTTKRYIAEIWASAECGVQQGEIPFPTAVTSDQEEDIAREHGFDALLQVDDQSDLKICYV